MTTIFLLFFPQSRSKFPGGEKSGQSSSLSSGHLKRARNTWKQIVVGILFPFVEAYNIFCWTSKKLKPPDSGTSFLNTSLADLPRYTNNRQQT